MKITSNIKVSPKVSNLFINNIVETYPNFIEFVESYYQNQEDYFGSIDIIHNLLDYYNIKNFKLNNLVEFTRLISDNNQNIVVSSTKGYPENGFIKIGDEYIYYNSKNKNTFINCIRGVSTSEIIGDELRYKSSNYQHHDTDSHVYNVAYGFSQFILQQFKYTYLQNLPNKLNSKINYGLLVSHIKDFYASKGTTASIKFLFKILYDDTTTQIKLKDRGFGAIISIDVLAGVVVGVVINNGGYNYSSESLYYPDIKIIGVGSGAILEVTSIVNGAITGISIINGGELYTANNNVLVIEKDFRPNEIVYGDFASATGVVDYWNPDTKELYLSKVEGIFSPNEIIFNDRIKGIIDTTKVIESDIDIITPYDNVIKTDKPIEKIAEIVLELDDSDENFDNIVNKSDITFKQNSLYDIKEIITSVSNINVIRTDTKKTIFAHIDALDRLYLLPQTKVNKFYDNKIYVDSTIGFPKSGVIKIGEECIYYDYKTTNKFLGLVRNVNNTSIHNLISGDIVLLYGAYEFGNVVKFEHLLVSGDSSCSFRLLGVSEPCKILDGSSGYNVSTFDTLSKIKPNLPIHYSWSEEIISIYDDLNSVYILSSGKINDNNFRTSLEQNFIKRFSKNNLNNFESETSKGIGMLTNGVEICSYKGDKINYGRLLKINIDNHGDNYNLPNSLNDIYPYLEINSTPYQNLAKIYAKLDEISLKDIPTNFLEGYTHKPDIVVIRDTQDNTGIGMELVADYDVSGVLRGIEIINPGKWYTKIPTIKVINGGKFFDDWVVPKENIKMSGFFSKTSFTNLEVDDINFDPHNVLSLDIPTNLLSVVYTDTPNITIPQGIGAGFSITTQLGKISSVTVESSGVNFFTPPNLKLINTIGTGAVLVPKIQYGKIIYVEILDGGNGYYDNPTLIVENDENIATFSGVIESWTKNIVYNNSNVDNNGGYVYNIGDVNLSAVHIPIVDFYPQYLQLFYTENNSGVHSSIIGWSYDGSPIYGSYGYEDPLDSNSTVIMLNTEWSLITTIDTNRPNLPIGTFVEDYLYNPSYLDEHNGRFCVTPDFPNGRYCYFASDKFPYFVGNAYKHEFDEFNHQQFDDNFDKVRHATRIYNNEINFPTPKNDIVDYIVTTDILSNGSIDSCYVEITGFDYQINDIILFDDDVSSAFVKEIDNNGGILKIEMLEININLDKIPNHKIISTNGRGAVLIFGSSSIGKIKSLNQISNGIDFVSDRTISYKLDTDFILDIKYNNTIESISVDYGGIGFFNDMDITNVDFKFNISTLNGSIVNCRVIDGGKYFESIPIIDVTAGGGTNAILVPNIVKSKIPQHINIFYGISKEQYVALAKIMYYDEISSTIQIKLISGNFDIIDENFYIWDELGTKIGKIRNIRNANIICKSNSQKIINAQNNDDSRIVNYNVLVDNSKYQQYSYTISSNHSLDEWKDSVVDNVHMLGNKLTSSFKLENIVKLYLHRQQQIYNLVDYHVDVETIIKISIYDTTLIKIYLEIHSEPEDLNKNTNFSKHFYDYMYYNDNYVYSNYRDFSIYKPNDLIWLAENDNKIILDIIDENTALVTDYSRIRFFDKVYGTYENSILSCNGVVQRPFYNYTVNNNLVTLYDENISISDDLILFNLSNAKLIYTDEENINTNSYNIKVNGNNFNPAYAEKLLVFINNVINHDFTLIDNVVTFSGNVTGKVYCIYSDNLIKLNLISLTNKIYNISNVILDDNSKILLFVNGVIQDEGDFSIVNNNLTILTDSVVNTVLAWNIDSVLNIDPNFEIVSSQYRKIQPAVLECVIDNGKLIDIDIVYAGLNYARYLKLKLNGGSNDALVLLETLNGSIIKFAILNGGSGYTNSNFVQEIYEFGNIQSQRYPLVLEDISVISLVPDVYVPIVLSITATPNILEVGTQLFAINLNWSLSRSPNTSLTITDISNLDIFALTGSSIINYNSPIVATKTYTITSVDYGHIVTESADVQFVFKNYWGSTTNTAPNNSEILSQSNSVLSSTKNNTYTFSNLVNEYIYVAYPVNYGIPTFTFESFVVTFQQQYINSFTNASGGVTDYYVYRSDNLLNTSVTVTIS